MPKQRATRRPPPPKKTRPRSRGGTRIPPPRRAHRRRRTWLWVLGAAVLAGAGSLWAVRRDPSPAPEEAFVGGDLHSLVAAPGEAGRIYVGGHEAVSTSNDEGRTWDRVATLDGADAMGWAFLDGLVAVGGHPGLTVSTDGGRSFQRRNEGLPATDIHSLGGGGGRLFAASPAVGVLRSDDGGTTWEVVTDQVGQSFMGRILVDPSDLDHLVASDLAAGAVESRDGGRTWTVLGGVDGAMWVSWDPSDPAHQIVSGAAGMAVTTDGGSTWESLDVPSGASLAELSPTDGETIYAAVHDAPTVVMWVSVDGGRTWEPI
jgi:photosystem II stability/assembly factor-like uncharacterized protein